MMARLALTALLMTMAALPGRAHAAPAEQGNCTTYRITGYAASEYPGWTADGSTTTVGALNRGEPIVAASYNIPLGASVWIEGLGTYRVADRGYLGARHLDVLVWSRGEAFELTGYREACWW
jgi:3D (Asp-Asp-Asp) domain-containing protein